MGIYKEIPVSCGHMGINEWVKKTKHWQVLKYVAVKDLKSHIDLKNTFSIKNIAKYQKIFYRNISKIFL